MAGATEASLLDCEMSIKTARLEKQYEKAIADSARLLDTERDRVRRMEHLLLQFDRDALWSQLDQANERLLGFTRVQSEARLQLDEAFQEIDRLDQYVQASSSEIERLKEELATLHNTSRGYSTLLTEKLHLSRELSNLKSELERLQTQDSSQQAMVAEKHAMERQLNSLELQLENEKHSHERTRAKSSAQAAQITTLTCKIEELQSDVTREQRAKQQHERDGKQQNAGWEKERSVLEGKLETLRGQLRSTKDKLQEAQHDLQQRRSNIRGSEGDGAEPRSRMVPLQRPGPSADPYGGVTIATPGAVRVQEKPKRQSALPGDKSAFSITPFLNRTGAAPRDTSMSSDVDEEEIEQAVKESHTSMRKPGGADDPSDPELSPSDSAGPTRALTKAKAGKTKPLARVGPPAASKVAKESKQHLSHPVRNIPLAEPEDQLHDGLAEQGPAKAKRRKLGSQRERNLFEDEDENEDIPDLRKPGRKLTLGAGRSSVLAAPLSSAASGGDRLARGGGFGAAVGFSPLKRDRMRYALGARQVERVSASRAGRFCRQNTFPSSSAKARPPLSSYYVMFTFSSAQPRAVWGLGLFGQIRQASSKRWQARQHKDQFTREATVQGLKSRAAFKLLQIDEKYRIFRSGQTVVDLGYAPGSWSQVAASRTQPNGRVLGVDIIPAQPPKGVSTIQGNFLAPQVQAYIQEFLRNPNRGRPRQAGAIDDANPSLLEPASNADADAARTADERQERTVDVVLSDMSAPWHQTSGFWKRSLSNPYNRMMNTSGNNFRDHAGSMDLCHSALRFSSDVLKAGGHFVCKFYQGAEDKELEKQLKDLFQKVHRLKPESSRSVRLVFSQAPLAIS
ncbi:uncharacterized protein N7482_010221 [Penicillium canariense]|uniref:rRNA methyltransferase 2, mitochondrial n=1 Tax=Penicillium canariense TaxID=189055 RepID=A0A9W9LDU8_9EURO|nr:uncharacterized protein N7482_010221 [Penicillium canariense]KAJ5150969.1 hypothetical protein N7482_010221 [Penicillium canariense]